MNNVSVFLFSTALSEECFNQILLECKKRTPTYSGIGFDNNIARGMSKNDSIRKVVAISFYPIPSWPRYRKLIKKSTEYNEQNLTVYAPAIINLPILKELSYYWGAKRYLSKCSVDNNSIVITSGLYRSLLRCAKYLKRKSLPIVSVVPDIPEIMMTYRSDYSKLRKKLNDIDAKNSAKYRDIIDGFVLLSPYMNGVVNTKSVPFCVMDGLVNISSFPNRSEDNKTPYILYAGKVSKKFGVDKLCDAFIEAKLREYELVICGTGDYSDNLKLLAANNINIKYLGAVSHQEVLDLEVNATLLVEPRPTDDILVKMSFPSKIIEYMASGSPVLCTNLPCFSEEYKRYQYRIDDESVTGIAKSLINTLSISKTELEQMGSKARAFVMENKTIDCQCGKIVSFIEEML